MERLISKRIHLREFVEEDWSEVHEYASNEKVSRFQPWGPNTETDTKEYVHEIIKSANKNPRTRYVFAVIEKCSTRMIGAAELNNIDF